MMRSLLGDIITELDEESRRLRFGLPIPPGLSSVGSLDNPIRVSRLLTMRAMREQRQIQLNNKYNDRIKYVDR